MKKLPQGKIALERKFTLKQKSFEKITHPFEYSSKSFAQKIGSVWKCWKKLFYWMAHSYRWLNKTLIFKNKSRCNSKKNKFKNGTFVRPTCIMVKAVLNLFIISKESYLIPWYILTIWLFQKSIAAMYLFTKSFRAYNCRKTMCFKKKRERALVKCKSFLHNNFFECKVPRELEKQLLSRLISTRNSVFFFRTWVNCMLTFERETFTGDTDLFKKDHLFTTNSFFPFLKPSRDSENQGSFEK